MESLRFRVLGWAIFVFALSLILAGLMGAQQSAPWPHLLVFGAASAVAGVLSVRSGSSTALSLDMPVLLAAGFVFGPAVGGALALVSYVDPREWRGEIGLSRALCNRGQTALSVMAGAAVFALFGGGEAAWPSVIIAGLLALATDVALNYLVVAFMTASRTEESVSACLSQLQLGPTRLFALMYFAYGLVSVLLAEITWALGLRGLVAFVAPLVLAKGGFEQSRQVIQLRIDADEKAEALRRLTNTIAEERRDERQVLAGELHDEVLPPLFKVHLMGQVLRQDLSSGRLLDLDDDLPELLSATETAQSAIRDVVRGLRASKIGPGGLEASLRQVAQRLENAGSPKFDFSVANVGGSESAQTLCYQLAREAMSNAARHSRASRIEVILTSADDSLDLTIRDDGVGFDPQHVDTSEHFGLSLIAERVEASQGSVDIRTGLGAGTTVHARIPTARGGHDRAPS